MLQKGRIQHESDYQKLNEEEWRHPHFKLPKQRTLFSLLYYFVGKYVSIFNYLPLVGITSSTLGTGTGTGAGGGGSGFLTGSETYEIYLVRYLFPYHQLNFNVIWFWFNSYKQLWDGTGFSLLIYTVSCVLISTYHFHWSFNSALYLYKRKLTEFN